VNCPLCHQSSGQQVRERISAQILRDRYRKRYGSEIKHLYSGETLEMRQCDHCDLIYYHPLVSGDEAFYNSLQHQPWYYVDEKPEFHHAAALIPDHASVLETGSGRGNFSKILSGRHIQYTGLDFSVKAKEMAAKDGVSIINDSIQHYSLTHKNAYDVACSFQVLEHVEDIHGFIQAQVDCLKPGGLLIIGVPAENAYIAKSFDLILNMPPHHLSRYTDACLSKIADVFSLELQGVWHEPLQPHHYFDYTYTLSITAIRKMLGIPYRSLESGILPKILKAFAWLPGKGLSQGLHAQNVPAGHTVVAAYRKPL
jgi:2-polyprenyl-3-methyl-5-hydroxy-6-metoxy-1,4-benzoquinol methylase